MNCAFDDPRVFWKIINEMNNWGGKQTDPADKITRETWEKHFKELLNGKNQKEELLPVTDEIKTFDPILDGIITARELRETLTAIKIGKAVGPDHY